MAGHRIYMCGDHGGSASINVILNAKLLIQFF